MQVNMQNDKENNIDLKTGSPIYKSASKNEKAKLRMRENRKKQTQKDRDKYNEKQKEWYRKRLALSRFAKKSNKPKKEISDLIKSENIEYNNEKNEYEIKRKIELLSETAGVKIDTFNQIQNYVSVKRDEYQRLKSLEAHDRVTISKSEYDYFTTWRDCWYNESDEKIPILKREYDDFKAWKNCWYNSDKTNPSSGQSFNKSDADFPNVYYEEDSEKIDGIQYVNTSTSSVARLPSKDSGKDNNLSTLSLDSSSSSSPPSSSSNPEIEKENSTKLSPLKTDNAKIDMIEKKDLDKERTDLISNKPSTTRSSLLRDYDFQIVPDNIRNKKVNNSKIIVRCKAIGKM